MATDFERLVVQLSADLRGYENQMKRAVGVTNARAREIEKRYRSMNASISQAVSAPLAGLGAALSVREITRYADSWTQAGNMIRAAAASAGVQVRSLEELRVGADEARTSLSTYADLYAKLIRSASGVAQSEEEIALATNLVSKAMKAGGASVNEQQAAILQLGQALGSGVLQGDELRSLRENAPVLAQAIADEFGVTIAELKKLGEEGALTSDRVFRAIINAQAGIEEQFRQTNATISDGLTKLGNAVTEFVGKLFESSGATAAINTMLEALAGNVESVGAAAAAAGAVILSSYIPALTRMAAAGVVAMATNPFLAIVGAIGAAAFALSAFGDDFTVIEGDMATFGDYARTIWEGVRDGLSEAAGVVSDAFLGALTMLSEAMGGVEVTWGDVIAFFINNINTAVGVLIGMKNATVAVFNGIGPAVAEGITSAIDVVITGVERMLNAVRAGVDYAIEALNSVPGVGTVWKPIETFGDIDLGRVTGDLEGSIQDLETDVAAAFKSAMERDYVGDALGGIRKAAETNAFTRKIGAAIDASKPSSTSSGFGGGSPSSSSSAGGGGGQGKGRTRKDELEKEIEQIKKRTAALQAETAAQAQINPLLDDYGYAVERASAMQELLTAAQEAGIAITPELRAQIEALSESYAQAVVASAKLGESQDEIRQRAEDMREASREASQGIVQDLLDGKSAADAFASALGKIGDRMLDLAFDSAFSKGGLFGGGGGGIFGALGSLLTGRREHGGPVRAGGAYLVGEKRPEIFVPNRSGTIIPKVPKAEPSGSSGTSNVRLLVDVRGATGNQEIQDMVARGVAVGMARVERRVPDIVAASARRR